VIAVQIPQIDRKNTVHVSSKKTSISLEVVSKPQIAFESEVQADEKVVVLSIHLSM
jgi:hypothetical protein